MPKESREEIKAGEAILWGGRSKTNKEADGAGQNEAETPSSTRDRNRRVSPWHCFSPRPAAVNSSSRSNPVNELWKPWDVISGKKYAATTQEEFSASQKDLLPFQASCEPRTWGWSQEDRMMNKPRHLIWVPLSSWIPAPLNGCWGGHLFSCLPHPDNTLCQGRRPWSLSSAATSLPQHRRSLPGQALWIRPHRRRNGAGVVSRLKGQGMCVLTSKATNWPPMSQISLLTSLFGPFCLCSVFLKNNSLSVFKNGFHIKVWISGLLRGKMLRIFHNAGPTVSCGIYWQLLDSNCPYRLKVPFLTQPRLHIPD